MSPTFWDGFYFGAGFAASQLIFIFIVLLVLGVPFLATFCYYAARRKKKPDLREI